jgi:RES domain-containing protein
MQVFRISRPQYAESLDGKGACEHGGRWNPKGIYLIYTAINRSLAMAEVLVHNIQLQHLSGLVMVTLDLPVKTITRIPDEWLRRGWDAFPPGMASKNVGLHIFEKNIFVFKVPSVVVPGDYNVLINPMHRKMKDVKVQEISPFKFDQRFPI